MQYMQKQNPNNLKGENPGRAVVNSIDRHVTKISKYMDDESLPHVKELMSYVKGSTDFTWKIDNMEKLLDNNIPVTMGVCSIYTNIPNKELKQL